MTYTCVDTHQPSCHFETGNYHFLELQLNPYLLVDQQSPVNGSESSGWVSNKVIRAWSAVCDLQHEKSGQSRGWQSTRRSWMLYQTRDHSSSAVNCVLHNQAYALTGLLWRSLTDQRVQCLAISAICTHGPSHLNHYLTLTQRSLKLIFVTDDLTRSYFEQ